MLHSGKTQWYVYLIRCCDDSLYTGVTTDVNRRFQEHKSQGNKTAKYLRGKQPLSLVYVIEVDSRGDGLRLEHKIKQMSKCKKESLIKSKQM